MLSDKEQKKVFRKIASENPDDYYPVKSLRKNGFSRRQCKTCGKYFWSTTDEVTCGEPTCNAGFEVVKDNPSKNKLSYIDVWKKIVEVLEPRGYTPIKRYPVVARWNPTTEFTIASIAAFQPYVVTGQMPPPAKKLLIPQMSLRFVDIENVGITGSHLTAFVMIGQHQFVNEDEWDQEQAFQDIFDYLVSGVGLEKSEFKIHEDSWAGGGSFGPCLEFFSRGVELFNQVYTMFEQTPEGNRPLQLKVLDMGLGMERVAWFTQGKPNIYEATFPQVLDKLREITNITLDYELYNRFSQYSAYLNIDEVENIDEAWAEVGEKLEMDPKDLKQKIQPMTAIYSIAEHSRALLFAISDGKLPSNVGGGYNLRVIFRRAMGFIDKFNWPVDMADVCEWHAEELLEIFPEVSQNLKEVRDVLNVEKEKFYATKLEAEKIVKRLIKKNEITTAKLIELYDSNGINPEIIQAAARKFGKIVKVPEDFYSQIIARHEKQEQIHATGKKIAMKIEHLPPTERLYFDDYLTLSNQARILHIEQIPYQMRDEEAEDESVAEETTAYGVIVDKSIAYPTSGGQMHDTGSINSNEFVDVVKNGNHIVHIILDKPTFNVDDLVEIHVNRDRRIQLAQNHSATHIVNAAARQFLGNHINQAGAKKTVKKAHLDITHYESLNDEQLDQIEKISNELVQKNIQSNHRFMSRAEAEKQFGMRVYQGGAIPGKRLRIVEVPGVEVEACGGTHVNSTGEIGRIKIFKSQKIQDGIVRLTFTAGEATIQMEKKYQYIKDALAKILETDSSHLFGRAQELMEKWRMLKKALGTGEYSKFMLHLTENTEDGPKILRKFKNEFKTPISGLITKFEKLKQEWVAMKSEIENIAQLVSDANIQNLIDSSSDLDDGKFIFAYYPGINAKILTNIGKKLVQADKSLVILLIGGNNNSYHFVAMRGEKMDNYNLRDITKQFLSEVKGKGGGRPILTQGMIPHYTSDPNELKHIFQKLF